MRRLLIIAIAGLVLMGAGCSRHEDDARLVRADALMASRPDSALAILDSVTAAIDSGALTFDEADAAYYALLLTQARYRCYIPATSDTLITRALRYYQSHPTGDRLARALLYRGTVAEELNDPTAAIAWYRQAESATPPENHALLGQVNLRIADLYRNNYANDEGTIRRYEKALELYELIRDSAHTLYCLANLGGYYRMTDSEKAQATLQRAISFAQELGDSASYVNTSEMLCFESLRRHAGEEKHVATSMAHIIGQHPQYCYDGVYYDAAIAYARMGKLDSATYYFHEGVKARGNNQSAALKANAQAELAAAYGDYRRSMAYKQLFDSLNRTDDFGKVKMDLAVTDEAYEQEHLHSLRSSYTRRSTWLVAGALAIVLVLGILVALLIMRLRRRRRAFSDLIDELRAEKATERDRRQQALLQNEDMNHILRQYRTLFGELMHVVESRPNTPMAAQVTDAIKRLFANCQLAQTLYTAANRRSGDALRRLVEPHHLPDDAVALLAMTYWGFSNAEIALCLGISSAAYVRNKKKRLADKLNLGMPLDDYIAQIIPTNKPDIPI